MSLARETNILFVYDNLFRLSLQLQLCLNFMTPSEFASSNNKVFTALWDSVNLISCLLFIHYILLLTLHGLPQAARAPKKHDYAFDVIDHIIVTILNFPRARRQCWCVLTGNQKLHFGPISLQGAL